MLPLDLKHFGKEWRADLTVISYERRNSKRNSKRKKRMEQARIRRTLATMVSRVSLAEAINIMHQLAVEETEKNVKEMSDEEKEAALEELRKGLEIAPEDDLEKTEEKSEE